MSKKLFCFLLTLTVGLCCCTPIRAVPAKESPSPPSVSAKAAVLIEAESGEVLFEKNAHLPMGMASTTKIMTALVALEQADPDQTVTIPKEAVGIEGSSIYLIEGETMTLRELLYALMLSSANDAATAIAIAVGGSEERFCDLMNQTAREMGLQSTRFENPHGLYHEEHYTTAEELARIAARALSIPLFREIVSTYTKKIPHDGIPDVRLLCNHNKLLKSYKGAIGVKTGFTKKTGRTLVSAAERDGMTLIAVTLDAPDDWRDHTAMLDFGFSAYRRFTFAPSGAYSHSFPVVGGKEKEVILTNATALSLLLPKDHGTPKILIESVGRFLYAPVQSGQSVCRMTLMAGDRSVSSILYATESVEKKPSLSLLDRLLDGGQSNP
ncbi:MAG: D-alanyl-D-alanine carboxypeptidase [Clostridia bacterium]|nr:D-alanyl-D-alanine carboxypeptidase [Clostridia bacterium]